jgi:hypothetical protein
MQRAHYLLSSTTSRPLIFSTEFHPVAMAHRQSASAMPIPLRDKIYTVVSLGSRRTRNHHCLYMNRIWHGDIADGLALRSRCRCSDTATFGRHRFRQIPHASCGFNPVWRGKRKASGIGPVLAMNGREMKATQQFDCLGQNCRPDNATRDLLSNPTQVQRNDELAGTRPAAIIQIGCQEEPL